MAVYELFGNSRKNIFERLSLTNQLIFLNVILFILFYVLMAFNVIPFEYIAIIPANILRGKYLWTFFTSMFMHGGIFHLFVNMFSLLFIGNLVEKLIGKKRYLWFYFASGLSAGLLFVLVGAFGVDFYVPAVGASGALFGLIGLLVILTPNLPVYLMFFPFPIKMKYAGIGMLIILWLISLMGDIPIGNVAHFGGLLVGLSYGFYLKFKFPRKTKFISQQFS